MGSSRCTPRCWWSESAKRARGRPGGSLPGATRSSTSIPREATRAPDTFPYCRFTPLSLTLSPRGEGKRLGGTMEPKIVGTVMPVLELNMQPNDKVFAESGQLSWMSMSIQMQTSTSAGGQQGGFMCALGRAVAGGTLFMTEYTALGGPDLLPFPAHLPAPI